jgi:hypothetical protein
LVLNNETIRVAVKDYLEGGEKKDAIIKKYGKIEDWDTSNVTDMFRDANARGNVCALENHTKIVP